MNSPFSRSSAFHRVTKRSFLRRLAALTVGMLAFPFKNPHRTEAKSREAEPQKIGEMEISYGGSVPYKREFPLSPPGSKSFAHLSRRCVACHLCVAQCPSHVLRPSKEQYAAAGFSQPTMVFDVHAFCNYDCTICGQVCPAGAIKPMSVEEKHRTQIGRVVFIKDNCVVVTDGTNCGACAEHCPTQAVHMVPLTGSLTIPDTNPSLCVGCGACESICPVRPYRAIHVEGLPIHGEAVLPEQTKQEETKLDDFGF